MPSVTITLPDEIKMELDKISWVNWSEVGREALLKELELSKELEKFKRIISKSKLSEKDAEILSNKVKLAMHKRLKDKGLI